MRGLPWAPGKRSHLHIVNLVPIGARELWHRAWTIRISGSLHNVQDINIKLERKEMVLVACLTGTYTVQSPL